MKKQARLTSKGQITIPFEVRRKLGVRAGDKLEFEEDRGGFHMHRVRIESPFAKYQGIGTPGIGRGRKAVVRYFRRMRGR